MTRLSEAASPAPPAGVVSNVPEYSVSEISQALKRTVEGEFGHVRVRGEISGFKRAASGHCYMTLKDDQSVLDAVAWKGTAARLSIRPEDGLEVIATGRLTTYPGRSKYQIVIEAIELAGEGALLKLLEERRRQLAAEGLFDEERKQPLPFLPDVIGVVTSPTGAVIRDILHRLADRFPRHVLVWPVLVQGDGAATQVANAIAGFNALTPDGSVPRPDLLIVARGGGSLEDLWAFNEEVVVRAAAASRIPLISAVGHETDTTLIDFAADRRAPTPTAAAEMAVPVRRDLLAQVTDDSRRLLNAMGRLVDQRRLRVEGLGRGLPDPRTLLETSNQRLDDRVERLGNAIRGWVRHQRQRLDHAGAGLRRRALVERVAQGRDRVAQAGERLTPLMRRRLADAETRLGNLAGLLDSYSYERVLDRGFALVRARDGAPITAAADARPGAAVSIQFRDGAADAHIDGGPGSPAGGPGGKDSSRGGADDAGGQASPAGSGGTTAAGPDAGSNPRPAAAKARRAKPAAKPDDKQGTLL